MAIFKNFPSVSKLVNERIFTKEQATLVYKINRLGLSPGAMANLVEGAGFKDAAEYLDKCIRQCYSTLGKRQAFKELLNFLADGMCGVELLGIHKRWKYGVEYLNAGDTYNTTLIFHNHHDGTVRIGCIGDSINQVTTGEY